MFALLATFYLLSIDLRASRQASITGDEPFYLLTTQSLIDDGDFDLRNQYEQRSYERFFDHPDGLWQQSVPTGDGRLLSPHNPGLSLYLIPGFAIAGLVGVQVQLLLSAALTFALIFVLVARTSERVGLSWLCTLAIAVTATPFIYATEIYPELPAGLAVVSALLIAARFPRGVGAGVALALVLSLLPWLGVKYTPLAIAMALFFAWHTDRRSRVALVAIAALSAAFYAWAHYELFGALTPYSVGTVHAGQSSTEVLGNHIDIRTQAYRLYGIFIDRRFGIGRWAPLLFIALAGVPLLFRYRTGQTVAALLGAQLFMGTFVAITMMGWWFPGRTMVTVIPLFALPLALFVDRYGRAAALVTSTAAAYSLAVTLVLAHAGHTGEVVIAVDPFDLSSPVYRVISPLFPNYTSWSTETRLLTAAWLSAGSAILLAFYWRPIEAGLRRAKAQLATKSALARRGH